MQEQDSSSEAPKERRRMKYLYCVIPGNKPQTFDLQGIGGQVYTVPYEDCSLVMSDSEPFPLASIRKEELLNYLLLHQSTIEKIMQKYSVVPLKFGTFLDGDKETQKIMGKGYPLFKESLQNLDGKIELNLVAMWANLNDVLKEIGKMEEIQRLKNEISLRPLSERVQGGIELGKRVKELLDESKDGIVEEIITALKNITLARCQHAVLNDNMIANVAFLIDKDKRGDFEKELEVLDKKHQEKINFKLVGPLPPYSFATFEIKKLTPDEIFSAQAVLGIVEAPRPEEVKLAYRARAGELHPDKNPGNPEAAKQFEELKKAFDLLYEYARNDRDLFSIKKLSWEQLNTRS